jgi:hypothetical protein
LKSNWEKELYIEIYTQEARRGIGWWKMGIWRLKCARGNTNKGMCRICSKEEGWSHILRCEGTRRWRDKLVEARFTITDPEIEIRKIFTNKNKDKLQKIGLYLNRYKEKWERLVKKCED